MPDEPGMASRKRKRPVGEYVDEETGETSRVLTSKEVKKAYRKYGKHYKEPTAAELRMWDREEEQRRAGERARKAEENKRSVARKREEQAAKEAELKNKLYRAGKITFTQTLARKDEDQLNLHKWFGGRPRPAIPPESALTPRSTTRPLELDVYTEAQLRKQESKDEDLNQAESLVRTAETAQEHVHSLSQEDDNEQFGDVDQEFFDNIALLADNNKIPSLSGEPRISDSRSVDHADMDDLDLSQSFDGFDIRADSDLEEDSKKVEKKEDLQQTDVAANLPVSLRSHLSTREPLVTMSNAQLNSRAGQTVKQDKNELQMSKTVFATSTQMVREVISGLCTQDLLSDDDELTGSEKENEQSRVTKNRPTVSDRRPGIATQKPSLNAQKAKVTTPQPHLTTNTVDLFKLSDDTFAHTTTMDGLDADDEQDFGEDDIDWTSLPPATQLLQASRRKSNLAVPLNSNRANTGVERSKQALKPSDSFAMPGVDNDDLIEASIMFENEQSQGPDISTPLTSAPTTISTKSRRLPWEHSSWREKTTAGPATQLADSLAGSQETTILEDS